MHRAYNNILRTKKKKKKARGGCSLLVVMNSLPLVSKLITSYKLIENLIVVIYI